VNPEEPQSATEQLLERSWEARARRASERELAVDASAGVLFVAAASALAGFAGTSPLHPFRALLLVAVYALVARVEFPVGAGYVVPTQLVLVPMLVLLPPAVVPVAVGTGLVLGNAIDWSLGRVPARRVLSALPDAWHAVGPVLVLIAAGSPAIGLPQLPILIAAVAAGCLVDLTASLVRMRLAGVVPDLGVQIQVIGFVWIVDACLAPLGLLAALQMRRHTAAVALVLPLVFLLWLLARDRSQRIDKAHRRLKLVEQERARLQSAVRRLGDAFAAKLDLDRLLEILLHGSVEALDAAAGRLQLAYGRLPVDLTVGVEGSMEALAPPELEHGLTGATQIAQGDRWCLGMPVRIAASAEEVTGSLWLVRAGRPFETDEVALIGELISKAELSAGEIIAHHEIREQAMTDPLTGLGNRRRLSADLAAPLADRPSLLLLFDLDGFKDYNDTFGHVAGDALLARLGAKLERAVHGWGRAYRLGGDEFCAHLEIGDARVDELVRRTSSALTERGAEFAVRASLGVVLLPQEAATAQEALRIADERMYANKRSRSTARCQAGEVLLRAMQAKQMQLDEHSATVAELAARVARRMGVRGQALEEIARAAQLHDVGKMGIPDEILNKPAALDAAEWTRIRDHTILGERILAGAPALRGIAPLVRASHERWDGAGYPDRLRGEEIPLGARIVTVCDAYEAMTSERAYRAAVSPEAAREELVRCAGSQFDPAVVDAFLAVLDRGGHGRELGGAPHATAGARTLSGTAAGP
jgi:diguanylate cyclase (GGDEF)-like protein